MTLPEQTTTNFNTLNPAEYIGQLPENGFFSAIQQAIHRGELSPDEQSLLPGLFEELSLPGFAEMKGEINKWAVSSPAIEHILEIYENHTKRTIDFETINNPLQIKDLYKSFRKTHLVDEDDIHANLSTNSSSFEGEDLLQIFVNLTKRLANNLDLYYGMRQRTGVREGYASLSSKEYSIPGNKGAKIELGESYKLEDDYFNEYQVLSLHNNGEFLGTFTAVMWVIDSETNTLKIKEMQKRIGTKFDYSGAAEFALTYTQALNPKLEKEPAFEKASRGLSIKSNKYTLLSTALVTKRLLDIGVLKPDSHIQIPYYEQMTGFPDPVITSEYSIPLPIETVNDVFSQLENADPEDYEDEETIKLEFYRALINRSKDSFASTSFDIANLVDPYPYDLIQQGKIDLKANLQQYKQVMSALEQNDKLKKIKYGNREISAYEYLDSLTNYNLTKEIIKLRDSTKLDPSELFSKALYTLNSRTRTLQKRYVDYPTRTGDYGMLINCPELIKQGLIEFQEEGVVITNAQAFAEILNGKVLDQDEPFDYSPTQTSYTIEELLRMQSKFKELSLGIETEEWNLAGSEFGKYQSLIRKIFRNQRYIPQDENTNRFLNLLQTEPHIPMTARNAFLIAALSTIDNSLRFDFERAYTAARELIARSNGGYNNLDRSNATDTLTAAKCIDPERSKFVSDNTFLFLNMLNNSTLLRLFGKSGIHPAQIRELIKGQAASLEFISPEDIAHIYFDTVECNDCRIQRCQIREHKLAASVNPMRTFMLIKNLQDAVKLTGRFL